MSLNRTPKQKINIGNASSRRREHTRRSFGQRLHSRPMPARIHLRAYMANGNILGIAQINDRFMVAVFNPQEQPLSDPTIFSGGNGRTDAATFASDLLGRRVSL